MVAPRCEAAYKWVMSAGELSERQRQVLLALCRQFVITGRPVASSSLCRLQGLECSSATVRNELGALERAGLVHKPHAASGRVPSAAGWRVYVANLPRGDARPEHRRLVDVSVGEGDPRMGLRATTRVLSELAGCVAIGFLGASRPGVVRALELVPLTGGDADSGRVLVMLGLEDGASSVRTVELDRRLLDRDGELRRVQGLLRDLTVGRSLDQARDHLRELLEDQRQRFDRCLGEALRIGLLLCIASFDPLWMQVAGHGSLLTREPGSAGEADSVAEVLDLLEDYQRLADILCQLLPQPDGDPRAAVRVDLGLERLAPDLLPGADARHPGRHLGPGLGPGPGLTLVGCRLRWPQAAGAGQGSNERSPAPSFEVAAPADSAVAHPVAGAVALLGSPRMDYEAVIPLVEYAARALVVRA